MSQNALGKASGDSTDANNNLSGAGFVFLAGLFITGLLTAQIISSKLLFISLPIFGAVAMPGGTLAYAVTFLATDCLHELYGKRAARRVINVAFALNFVLLGLVYLTIWWPHAGGVPQDIFAGALAPAGNIVVGSLTAYLLSQHTDVILFDTLRTRTGGDRLWLRNLTSTGVSQAIDTTVFTLVAFVAMPAVAGIGTPLPLAVVGSLILGQYAVKALIAVLDTPVVYLVVKALT